MKTTAQTVTVGGVDYSATVCGDFAMALTETGSIAILGRIVGSSDTHELLAIVCGTHNVFVARAAIEGLASGKIKEENLVDWKNSAVMNARRAA